jgi:hypothetical protein
MSEQKLYFVMFRSVGINTILMKELVELFRNYHNTLILSENIGIFENLFNEYMKNYTGRAKPPICKYFKAYKEESPSCIEIYVVSKHGTPAAAIYLDLTPVKGAVAEDGEVMSHIQTF